MDTEQFGQYRLESLIGRGGMGEVYRAHDTVRGRVVALKRLPAHLASDREFQARFRKESALASRLTEAHIIPIHDFGEIDGRLYIDMRLVEGRDLSTVLSEDGPLAPEAAVAVVSQVASALAAAHADGLVHRDVKPSNVLVTDDAFVYLVDFGIARSIGSTDEASLTAAGATIGTLDYMAPERFSETGVDHRVDVYSLACLLFETLTGRKPFRGEGPATMIHAHLTMEPPKPSRERPSVPIALDAVVAKGMSKDPEDRYPTARALADAALAAVRNATGPGGANGERRSPIPAAPPLGYPVIPGPRQPAHQPSPWSSNRSPVRLPNAGFTAPGSTDPPAVAAHPGMRASANQRMPLREPAQGAYRPRGAYPAPAGHASPSPPPAYGPPAVPARQGRPESPGRQGHPGGPRPRRWLVAAGIVTAAIVATTVVVAVAQAGSENPVTPTVTPTTTQSAAPPATSAGAGDYVQPPSLPSGDPVSDKELWDSLKGTGVDWTRCEYVQSLVPTTLSYLQCFSLSPTLALPLGFESYATPTETKAKVSDYARNLVGTPGTCDAGGTFTGPLDGKEVACGTFTATNGNVAYYIVWAPAGSTILGVVADADPAMVWRWFQAHDPI